MTKTKRYDELKAGDVFHYGGKKHVCEADIAYEAPLEVQIIGRAKRVAIGTDQTTPAFLHRGTLYVGCQRINAIKAFRALGEALGYDVDD